VAMTGTEFARIKGSYSTAFIGTYEVANQNINNNSTTFKLRAYFYYGGGTQVTSSYSTFKIDGTTVKTGSYSYNPGYHLLGTKSITITHNNDGTFPGKSIKIYADSWHMSGTKTGNITAPKINRLATMISGQDFNDENNPTIQFSNSANYQVVPFLKFYLNNTLIYTITRNKALYTSPYTWELTVNERTAIRTALSESNTCVVEEGLSTYNGDTLLGNNSLNRVFTIINANPTFNNFTYADTNSTTIALTGNNQKIIKNYSNVEAKVVRANQAQAIKNTTMSNYKFVCGDNFVTFIYNTTPDYTSGTINKVTAPIFNVYAVDKRGNTKLVSKTANTFIEYTEIEKGTATTERNNGTSEQTILNFTGKISKVNFGSVTNSIKVAKYRYKTTNSTIWSNYTTITSHVTTDANGNFSFNRAIAGDTSLGFNAGNSYHIEIVVNDELSSITYSTTLGSALPNIALHKDGVSIMAPYDPNVGGKFQVDGEDVMSKINYVALINSSDLLFDTTKRITITPTSGASYSIYGNCYYYKIGTKVHIHIGISNLTANSNTQIFTMPTGYRPDSYIVGIGIGNTLAQKSALQIGDNGAVTIRTEGQYALIDFEYNAVQ
jgi:hypothetical protein